MNALCPPCNVVCLTCVGPTTNNCTTCDDPNVFRTLFGSSCPCNNYYYETNLAVCGTCDYSCYTCTGTNNTACLTCNPNDIRTLMGP